MTESMIETVARLKELSGHEAAPSYVTACDEFRYETDVLNAAPALLGVLGEVREGDAGILCWMLTGVGEEPTQDDIAELLSRYQALAAKMGEMKRHE